LSKIEFVVFGSKIKKGFNLFFFSIYLSFLVFFFKFPISTQLPNFARAIQPDLVVVDGPAFAGKDWRDRWPWEYGYVPSAGTRLRHFVRFLFRRPSSADEVWVEIEKFLIQILKF
jgi:hypothetical protein